MSGRFSGAWVFLYLFQTSIVQCRAGGWRAGPQGWSQAPGRTCAQKAKDTEAEPPAWLCLPTGGPLYFFLHHSGTGGQESESQGLSTSEIKRTSQGRTHTGLGQDWGGGRCPHSGLFLFLPCLLGALFATPSPRPWAQWLYFFQRAIWTPWGKQICSRPQENTGSCFTAREVSFSST